MTIDGSSLIRFGELFEIISYSQLEWIIQVGDDEILRNSVVLLEILTRYHVIPNIMPGNMLPIGSRQFSK